MPPPETPSLAARQPPSPAVESSQATVATRPPLHPRWPSPTPTPAAIPPTSMASPSPPSPLAHPSPMPPDHRPPSLLLPLFVSKPPNAIGHPSARAPMWPPPLQISKPPPPSPNLPVPAARLHCHSSAICHATVISQLAMKLLPKPPHHCLISLSPLTTIFPIIGHHPSLSHRASASSFLLAGRPPWVPPQAHPPPPVARHSSSPAMKSSEAAAPHATGRPFHGQPLPPRHAQTTTSIFQSTPSPSSSLWSTTAHHPPCQASTFLPPPHHPWPLPLSIFLPIPKSHHHSSMAVPPLRPPPSLPMPVTTHTKHWPHLLPTVRPLFPSIIDCHFFSTIATPISLLPSILFSLSQAIQAWTFPHGSTVSDAPKLIVGHVIISSSSIIIGHLSSIIEHCSR